VPRLSSTVIAVTGASAGIGRATARALAADGAAVVVSARRAAKLDELVREIRAAGGRALAVPGDVTKPEDMQALVERGVEAFGRLDVMICNAGIGYYGPFADTPPDAMRRVVDVNLLGTLYAACAALEVFRRQGRGHIIAVSSIAGRRGIGGSALYSATKAGQIGLVEALRSEFAGTRIRASIVYPVSTVTELHDAFERVHGRRVEGHGPRQSAEVVARAIVRCVRKPRAEVYPLARARWLAVLGVLLPAATDRLVRRFGRRVSPGGTPNAGPDA